MTTHGDREGTTMRRSTRGRPSRRGPVALIAVAALTLTACTSGEDPAAGGAAGDAASQGAGEVTATSPTTTSSTPVPGPDGQPVELPAPAAQRWADLGGAAGPLGLPLGPPTEVAGGSVTDFERGSLVVDPQGRAFVVQGQILAEYREAGGPAGELGFPTSDETTTDGGWISTFENGTITFIDEQPAVEVG